MTDIVERHEKAVNEGQWVDYNMSIAVDEIKRLRGELETIKEKNAPEIEKANAHFLKLENEIERLRKQNEFLKTTIRGLDPEKWPGPFIHALLGKRDENGMPEKFLIVPTLGVDFSYVYEYNGNITGTEW